MAGLLDTAQQRLMGLLNVPTEVQRFATNPQAFLSLLGVNKLPQATGFAAGATGLPPKDILPGGVLNPPNLAYQQGYEQGEPISYAAMAAPMALPVGKALAPKAGQMAENYLRSIGGVADIVPVETARSIRMPTTLPADDIFKKAVENTPGATVTDEGLVMNLVRKQKPSQAETESVRGGVFYLPEGSTGMKHYGGTGFYGGTEKIAGETLYKNPLVVKGATGGKAPEAAYEQLAGKESYKEMQNEVSRIISDYGSGKEKVIVDGVATDSPVASRILRMGGNPESFVESMQSKLNTQKQALEKASKDEVLFGVSEYDIAKLDLDSTLSMIEEAKSYVGKRIGSRKSTIVDVENFLDKYAPDLSGYGNYIIDNSKQGNQLKYALQEAAVAQRARDAGYDAVIGYSKKKSGDPFLSEVFDVREATYPSTQGDYRLMDKFEGLLD